MLKHPAWNWFLENILIPAVSVLFGLALGATFLVVIVKAIIFLYPYL